MQLHSLTRRRKRVCNSMQLHSLTRVRLYSCIDWFELDLVENVLRQVSHHEHKLNLSRFEIGVAARVQCRHVSKVNIYLRIFYFFLKTKWFCFVVGECGLVIDVETTFHFCIWKSLKYE